MTETALAAGLPLDDRTVDRISALALSNTGAVAELAGFQLPSSMIHTVVRLGERGLRAIKRLWRARPKQRGPGRPRPQRRDDENQSEDGQEPLEPRAPFAGDDRNIPQIGDDKIDAQLRGNTRAIRDAVEAEATSPKYRSAKRVDATNANADSIQSMRDDGRLKPDEEGRDPYRVDMPVYITKVDRDRTEFVRITSNKKKPEGFWIMPKNCSTGLCSHLVDRKH